MRVGTSGSAPFGADPNRLRTNRMSLSDTAVSGPRLALALSGAMIQVWKRGLERIKRNTNASCPILVPASSLQGWQNQRATGA